MRVPSSVLDHLRYPTSRCQSRTIDFEKATDEHGLLRCHRSIIWAAFERAGQPGTEQYCAGLAFMDAHRERVEVFSSRHRRL